MHYTALQNYSVSAGRPPAQKAPAMAATYSISAASGELMIPENAGVVLQAKSGINAIRVSGTATTTAGIGVPGANTTANQIQFYSNDSIVAAFDQDGLYFPNAKSNVLYLGTLGYIQCNTLTTIGNSNLALTAVSTTSGANPGIIFNVQNPPGTNGGLGQQAAGYINNGGMTLNGTCPLSANGGIFTTTLTAATIFASAQQNQQNALVLTRTGAGQEYGVGIDFRLTGSNTHSYARVYGGWVNGVGPENSRGYIALDVNSSGTFAPSPLQSLIYGDVNNGVIINNRLNLNSALLANSSVEIRAGNIMYFTNPANAYSWSFKTDSSNIFHMMNQFSTDYIQLRDDIGVVFTQPFRSYSAGSIGSSGYIGTGTMGGGAPSLNVTDSGGVNHFKIFSTSPNFNIRYSVTNRTLIGDFTAGTWSFDSDFNLKTNIINLSSSLQNILNLKPVTFNYKTEPNDPPIAGFIAQDVQPYFPRLVSRNILPDGTENPYLSLSQTGLIPYLVKAIQEQHEEIMNLKFIVSKLVK